MTSRPAASGKRRTARTATAPEFDPVALRARHDGWTPARQVDFIEALAAGGCVAEAARSVGMSKAAAYKLRARADAQAFRLAWDAAIDFAMAQLVDAAVGRAIHGVPVPIFHQGEQVGERRDYPEHLAMFLLAAHAPARFGRQRQAEPAPLMHFDAAGLQFAKMVALLDEQAREAEPHAFPSIAQMRRAAAFLGVDLDLFLASGGEQVEAESEGPDGDATPTA